jgi:hypothetical protein
MNDQAIQSTRKSIMNRSTYRSPPLLRTPATLAALTTAVVLALAGCGSHSSEATATSARLPQNSATPQASEPPVTATAPMAGPGLIELHCIDGYQPMQLLRIDPATGATLAQENVPWTFNSPLGAVILDGNSCLQSGTAGAPTQLETRELFSQDFTKVMATSAKQSDGSTHVGYVTLATGNFTDLTPAITTSGGFGAAIPVLSEPMFDAATGDRWFNDTAAGKIYDCSSDATCQAVTGYTPPAMLVAVLHGVWQLTGSPGDPREILSPGGKLIASSGIGSGFGGGLVITRADHQGQSGAAYSDGAMLAFGGQAIATYPAAWLTDTSVLAVESVDGALYYVNGVKEGLSGQVAASLALPTNKSTNTSYMTSPDSTHFAFLSTAPGATITEIYTETVGSNPPQSPTKVGEAGSANDKLLAWQ